MMAGVETPAPRAVTSFREATARRAGPGFTLAEKLHRGVVRLEIPVDDELGERLVVKLDQIEAELDDKGKGLKAEQRAGAIRYRRIGLRGLLPFKDVSLDVDALPGDVVALVGPIGVGKSVFLEAPMIACYRKGPTRGTLKDLADAHDAEIEVVIETSTGRWTVAQRLDGPHVFDSAGFHTVKGNAKGFVEWSRRHLPPAILVQASVFMPQKSRGLLLLGAADTKDLLLSMSGSEVYMRVSTMAAARARACERSADEIGGRIEEQRRTAATADGERRAIGQLAVEVEAARKASEAARAAANEARGADPGDPGAALEAEAHACAQRAEAARASLEAMRRTRHGFERGVLAAGPRIRAAGADAARLAEEHRSIEAEIAELERQAAELDAKLRDQKDTRIVALRAAIERLGAPRRRGRSGTTDAAELARAALHADRAMEEQAAAIPELLGVIAGRKAERKTACARAAQALFEARQLHAQLPGLEQAEQLHAESGRAIAAAEQGADRDVARATELFGQAAAARADLNRPDVARLEAEARRCEAVLADLKARAAAADARLEAAQRAARRMETSESAFVEAKTDLADWQLIERAFGREGVQAVEVDAMGPSLVRIANELLEETAGRWEVESDEAFEIAVIDHRQGRRRKGPRALSAGEQALVGEALTGALTMLACERAPNVSPTLIRDETGADLDRLDAGTWIRMLRREAEMVGASKVIVASHDRHVVLACDARMLVKQGSIQELVLKEVR